MRMTLTEFTITSRPRHTTIAYHPTVTRALQTTSHALRKFDEALKRLINKEADTDILFDNAQIVPAHTVVCDKSVEIEDIALITYYFRLLQNKVISF